VSGVVSGDRPELKTILRNLTGAMLVAAAALGMGRPQGAAQEISLSDIKAQQPQETIYASAPCQRAGQFVLRRD
jgi:hypothetical protein